MNAILHADHNGKNVLFSRKNETPRKARGKKMTQDEVVLNYLLTGNPLSEEDAQKLFGCRDVSAPVCRLRKRGWVILTQKNGGANGETTIYWMKTPGNESRRDMVMPLFSVQEKHTEANDQPEPTTATKAKAREVGTLTVRVGQNGPEIQITPEGSGDGEFFALSPTQVRYLIMNLDLFA